MIKKSRALGAMSEYHTHGPARPPSKARSIDRISCPLPASPLQLCRIKMALDSIEIDRSTYGSPQKAAVR
jgi:hypothetical protein